MSSSVLEKFLKYVSYDTQSCEGSDSYPSTENQRALAQELVRELLHMGVTDAEMDKYGYVTGTIRSNSTGNPPVLGLVAHFDTSPDMSGANVKPKIEEKYSGGDITLSAEKNIVMRANEFSFLADCIGQDIVHTDGTTLLGADDKAGIAEIMAAAEALLADGSIPHGEIKIGFTPDEEVGAGTEHFDVAAFGADIAYTVDGGALGELEYENFNAASVKAEIFGVSIHPGSAKNKMINAITLGMELHAMLPPAETPEHTEGYEGFYHLCGVSGEVEHACFEYIVRDHDYERFSQRIETLKKIAAYLNDKYGEGSVVLHISQSYLNMKEKLLPHFHLVDTAREAMESLGITPIISPIRGGTDGARLSYMGLPCPNLGTGGYNFHGRYECIPVQSMEKTVELLLEIIKLTEKKTK